MKRFKNSLYSLLAIVIVASTAIATPGSCAKKQTPPAVVGMIRLLANPEKFSGTAIRTLGFLNIGQMSENDCLLLHSEDGSANLFTNWLTLELSSEQRARFLHLNHTYVLIEGTFFANPATFADKSGGRITRVIQVSGWSPYESPLTEPK
jgi:hypothetical protein